MPHIKASIPVADIPLGLNDTDNQSFRLSRPLAGLVK